MNSRDALILAITIVSISMLASTMFGAVYSQGENVVQIIFYIDTGLGGPQIINDCSGTVTVGGNVSCVVEREIRFDNNTKIVFKGWYRNGDNELVTIETSIRVTAEENVTLQEYTAKYQVYYLIEIDLGYSQVRDWKPRNSLFTLAILDVWEPGEGVRKVFSNWKGDITGETPYVYIEKISKPLKAEAVWQTQYYVKIVSEYALSVESGWFNEGQELSIKPSLSEIYENNGETKILVEKYVVDYWFEDKNDFEVNRDSFKLVVDSSLTIKAVWMKLHHVILESSHVKSVLLDEWVRDGDRLIYDQLEEEITWINGTRIIFEKWVNGVSSNNEDIEVVVTRPLRAYATWRVYYLVSVDSSELGIEVRVNNLGWVEKGSYVVINATPTERELRRGVKALFREWSGSIISSNPVIEVLSLNQPIIVKALWVKKYLVTIETPVEVQMPREVWIQEGEEYSLMAPLTIPLDAATRLVFKNWIGCYTVKDNTCILENINHPLTLKADYFIEKKIRIEAISLNDEVIEEVYFTLKHESGEVMKLMSGETAWMKTGGWTIENASWRNYDVVSMKEFKITKDSNGVLRASVRIFRLSFKINDYLGFPVKDASIIIETIDGKVIYEGKTNEDGILNNAGPLPPIEMVAYITYGDYQLVKNVNLKTSSPIYITIPMSQKTIQIIVATIIATGSLSILAVVRRRRKRKEIPVEIPLPPEPPPPPTLEEDLAVLEREAKKAPIVTLEDVVEKLKMSGEKPEEILGELAEKIETKKKQKRKRKTTTST